MEKRNNLVSSTACIDQQDKISSENNSKQLKRRRFLRQLGVAATGAAAVTGVSSIASAQTAEGSGRPTGGIPTAITNPRVIHAYDLRMSMARQDALAGVAANIDNGDLALYADKGASYTKGLPHDSYGRVDPTAFAAFQTALKSGRASDFEAVPLGGSRKLTGPQGGLAYNMESMDPVQFGPPQVPPAPAAASDQTATELIEHYWASLLRDVPFTQYASNPIAAQAAAEISSQPSYQGPRNASGAVTSGSLFRGSFPGETAGPYVSQFMLQSAYMGSQPISQAQWTYMPDTDYATDWTSWLSIQNGIDTGLRNQMDPTLRYFRNGRDLAAVTHMDVLFQEYLMAFLVLSGINPQPPGAFGTGGAPYNPGNPYNRSKTQSGFGTFGGPDMAAALGEVAVKALSASWYQKWFVHLRARPESLGGIVHLLKTGQQDKTDVRMSPVILNSQALQQSFSKYGTYLLPQAFPEGSPTHPSYPTGHGVVAGACVTVLKFFFDGSFVIPNPVVSSDDGLTLVPYTGADAGEITVNTELNKLGHNVSFGHGIHAAIHYRSDTDSSLLLGEAVAISFLRDKAKMYNEPFSASLTKFDGSTETITNAGNP